MAVSMKGNGKGEVGVDRLRSSPLTRRLTKKKPVKNRCTRALYSPSLIRSLGD